MMTKIYIHRSLFIMAFCLSMNAGAASMILTIDPGSNFLIGYNNLDVWYDMVEHDGIRVGEVQLASGAHEGFPDGSESPSIDEPWVLLGNTAMHVTTQPVEVLSTTSNTLLLDFSGWGIVWGSASGEQLISLGSGLYSDGTAQLNCATDCAWGDAYDLSYSVTLPDDHVSGFGGTYFEYNLSGHIQAVPLPASAGLFIFGLLGMSGFMARGKRALLKNPVNDEVRS